MREILFRGKLLGDGGGAGGNHDIKKSGVCIITPDETPVGCYGQVDPETVGQYTGLNDRHGKRIFEGDIVTFKTSVYTFKPCVVEYSNAETRFVARIGDIRYAMTDPFVYEVIGNIHDNPEMIGGAEDGN